jgi:hypothetical protein
MNNRRLPKRRLFRARRHNSDPIIRYLLISIITLMFVIAIIAFAVLANKSDKNNTSSEVSELQQTTSTTILTTTDTTTTLTETTTPTTITESTALKAVGDEYFADACFIGDSRTQGLMMYSAPKTATFYAIKGMTVASFFNDKAFEKKTLTAEQVLKKKKYKKVYIMLGLNELGWQHSSSFIKRYGELVDSVKSSQPDAKIFIQSILPVSAKKSASHQSFNNPRILQYNKLIYDMCVEKKVVYLNVFEAVQDKDGNLPEEATTDGIHMNREYCDKWMAYLRTHTDTPVAVHTTVESISTSTTVNTTASSTLIS